MTREAAIALYRAEKAAAVARGADLTSPKPMPGRYHLRTPAVDTVGGVCWPRKDAFRVGLGRP